MKWTHSCSEVQQKKNKIKKKPARTFQQVTSCKKLKIFENIYQNSSQWFVVSGHDTTASAISWILYSLAENPEYQRKCQEEIDKVISETKSGQLEW